MLFLLKKTISYWLMPLPACLALLVLGLWWTRAPQRQRRGRILIGVAIGLLLLFGNKTVSVWLVQPFEAVYSPIPEIAAGSPVPPALAECRFIVVLGSGSSDTPGFSAMNKLCEAAHGRLAEALRLLRVLPHARLVTSGPGNPGQASHASVLADAAASLGFDRSKIILLESVRDTEDESMAIKQVVGDAPFALVTSAWHMPRAMMLMRGAGLRAVACPADYAARRPAPLGWDDLAWDVESLGRSTSAVHEALGLVWARLKKRG